MRYIIDQYGDAGEYNEMYYNIDVDYLISQIEIYDQVWSVRGSKIDIDENGMITDHSREAIDLVKEFISELEAIPDDCAEHFPFETIDRLKKEYLGKNQTL